MSSERRKTRSQDPKKELPPPDKFKGVWFEKDYVDRGKIPGTVTKMIVNGHPLHNEDVFVAEYVDGDTELLTKDEVEDLIKTAKCDKPAAGLTKRAKRHETDSQPSPSSKRGRPRSKASTPKSGGKKKDGASSSSSAATPSKRSVGRPAKGKPKGTPRRSMPDSFYGEQYTVEKLLDRKYEPALKYLVRWMGDWSPQEKETWEDVNNINPDLTGAFDKEHGAPKKPTMSSRQLDKVEAEKKKALKDFQSLLEYLEPPSWAAKHKSTHDLSEKELLDFPLSDFVKEYSDALAEVIKKSETADEGSQ